MPIGRSHSTAEHATSVKLGETDPLEGIARRRQTEIDGIPMLLS